MLRCGGGLDRLARLGNLLSLSMFCLIFLYLATTHSFMIYSFFFEV
jgi:hypothetical protein